MARSEIKTPSQSLAPSEADLYFQNDSKRIHKYIYSEAKETVLLLNAYIIHVFHLTGLKLHTLYFHSEYEIVV